MQRYSKKRQAIIECLQNTNIHPTVEWIYENLQPVYPDLSLATVYRNIGQLKKAGMVRSVGVVNGYEHFDANMQPHSHAVCSHCGSIVDIEDMHVSRQLIDIVENTTGYHISEAALQFTGICENCLHEVNQV